MNFFRHGTHPGYFLSFSKEFLDMEVERRWKNKIKPFLHYVYHKDKTRSSLKPVLRVVCNAFGYLWV